MTDENQEVDPRFPLVFGEHIYRGRRYRDSTSKSLLERLEHFEVKESDWYVATYPKSGTTWMQEIMSLIRDGNTERADSVINMIRVPYLDAEMPSNTGAGELSPGLLALKKSALPEKDRTFKVHLPADRMPQQIWTKKPKMVVVFRDPRDTAVSFYHMYKSLQMPGMDQPSWTRGWDEFFEMFISGNCWYGDWFTWIQGWWKGKDDSHMLFITYEWMKLYHKEAVQKVANFFETEISPEFLETIVQRTSFESMKNDPMVNGAHMAAIMDPNQFIRKGIVGGWKKHFTDRQSETFDALYKEKMKGYEDLNAFLINLDPNVKIPQDEAIDQTNCSGACVLI